MMDTTMKYSNHGLNIRRIRERKHIKQEALADKIGISQSALSNYENKEQLDDEVIEKIAKALEVPVEAITSASDDAAINIFSSTLHNSINYYPTFNPVDKVVELYERMLKEKEDKIALLEKTIEKMGRKN